MAAVMRAGATARAALSAARETVRDGANVRAGVTATAGVVTMPGVGLGELSTFSPEDGYVGARSEAQFNTERVGVTGLTTGAAGFWSQKSGRAMFSRTRVILAMYTQSVLVLKEDLGVLTRSNRVETRSDA
jgi:hypothetical protein